MIKMKEDTERKLKRERVQICLNCKRFVECDGVGKFEECGEFKEVEGEAWVIEKLENSPMED